MLPLPFSNARLLRTEWPDVFKPFNGRYRNGEKEAAFLIEQGVIHPEDSILDIGGGVRNRFVKELLKNGFKKAVGIDPDPRIFSEEHLEAINIRDLSAARMFDVIHFMNLLCYFRDYRDPHDIGPSPRLLALKADIHTLPGGLICINDTPGFKRHIFLKTLQFKGYKREIINGWADRVNNRRVLLRKPFIISHPR